MAAKKRSTVKGDPNMEHFEKRVGILLVEKGFITADQLIEGLKIQVREDLDTGRHRLLGRIFLEQNLITQRQLDDILKALWKKAKTETRKRRI